MVEKEEDGTITSNQAYDKFQANQDKAQKMVLWLATTVTAT